MKKIEKIIYKVGTQQMLNFGIEKIVKDVSKKYLEGYKTSLVISGAVEYGKQALKKNNLEIEKFSKKLLAGIGSDRFLSEISDEFLKYNILTASFLVKDLNFKKILLEAVDKNILAVLNGNDVLFGKDLLFDDNDSLASKVSEKINADLLVIVTDVDAVYDRNPKEFKDAKKYKIIEKITEEMLQNSKGSGSKGTGGMYTKLLAAKKLLENRESKTNIIITNSFDDVDKYLKGEEINGSLILNN